METEKSVEVAKLLVVEEMENSDTACEVEAAKIDKSEYGVEVPIPTRPLLATMKFVAVEDPTTNWGVEPMALAFTERRPHGVVVETPSAPEKVEVPRFPWMVVVAVPPT